ncbi:uncharacterized protein [Anabrus simplex]|uniref:uncharacterized protein n=1 Tax=Anabrus simplex TaxID=316456 RepID=UPI0035A29C86
MTVLLSRSCCGCTLKKGAIITGFINAFVGGCLLLFYVEEQIGMTYENSHIHDDYSQELIMISTIAGAVSLLTGIFLVVGARKEHSVMLLCWLIVYAVYIMLLAAGLMYGVFLLFNSLHHSDTTASVFLFMGLVVIGVLLYSMLVVFNFYQLLLGKGEKVIVTLS